MNSITVAIALGSNLGDRQAHLDWAVDAIGRRIADLRASTYLDTAAMGVPDAQPRYLNAAAVGSTTLPPRQLLQMLLALEAERGRARTSFRAARTLDLDLILYGDLIVNEPDLIVPHPRFRQRRFVLEPLGLLIPDVRDPVTGKTVAELLEGATD